MAYSTADIATLFDLFRGNTNAYGVTTTGEMKDGKLEGKSHLEHKPLTLTVLQRHCTGEQGIGVAPICDDSTCSFGAIDIDSYDYDLMDIVRAIYDFQLPLFPCWSKSHKLHIYLFLDSPANATDVRSLLQWYTIAFACRPRTEIFPKQSTASSSNTFYSWINLPYFDADNPENPRKLIKRDNTLAELPPALEYAKSIRKTLRDHLQFIKDLPYSDAPPCVLQGVLLRDIGPGQRNNWLLSVGVYNRLRDENCDLYTELSAVNDSLPEPIPDDELRKTVVAGLQRKTYFYLCSEMSRCNKACCAESEFGLNARTSSGLDYGQMTQYMTDPPYYEWVINGQKMTFWNEQELLGQNKFRSLCMRTLHIVPRVIPDAKWTAILRRAFESVSVIQPSSQVGDFTTGSTFKDIVSNFFFGRRRADNISQVSLGRVYEDGDYLVFQAHYFLEFAQVSKQFRSLTNLEMRNRFQEMGAYQDGNIWRIPTANVPVLHKDNSIPNFRDKEDPDAIF